MPKLTFDEINARVRAEHRGDIFHAAGGCGWSCSCGRVGHPGTGYPSAAQAQARLERHLRGAFHRIRRESER